MAKKIDRDEAVAACEGWKTVSRCVRMARNAGIPSQSNRDLDAFAERSPLKFLLPLIGFWKGENYFLEGRLAEAAKAYGDVVDNHKKRTFLGVDARLEAMKKLSACQERIHDVRGATKTLMNAARDYPDNEAEILFDVSGMLERAEQHREAEKIYKDIVSGKKRIGSGPYRDYATRTLHARKDGADWMHAHPTALAQKLSRCIARKDAKGLQALASKSHFSLGTVGSHTAFADVRKTIKKLSSDLGKSGEATLDAQNIRVHGGKAYLASSGWDGDLFRGRLTFILAQTPQGWEWRGVAGSLDPKPMARLLSPDTASEPAAKSKGRAAAAGSAQVAQASLVPDSPADLNLKSPWPAGRFFRAGGLFKFIQEQTAVTFTPWPFNMIVLGDFVSRLCGWGPNGYYYDQGPTHSSRRDRFSIDFTSHERFIAYKEISTGTPVLAVSTGVVTFVRDRIASGDSQTDNRVQIDHYTDDELLAAIITAILTGDPLPRSRYSARYLHLEGPDQVPVSAGMFVEQGTVLGSMDDTGNSAGSHLHFSMHDNADTNRGVRPTPMDSQTLLDGEDGKCLFSTNIPIV